MAGIENMNFGAGYVPPIRFSLFNPERQVVATPTVRGAVAGGGEATPVTRYGSRGWSDSRRTVRVSRRS
jgi:hypothetical protein